MKPDLGRFILLILTLGGLFAFSASAEEPKISLDYSRFQDRLRGGWAGQMIGVSYGSIYEFKAQGHTIDEPIRHWQPDFVANTIHQDDLYVEMTFLATLQRDGLEPTPRQVGEAFRDSQYELWHANAAARFNLRTGIMPPESGQARYNPHSDDIDFQIEADLFGLIAPGLFSESARLCDRFGTVMNEGDGLYGGLFIAAAYAQAYLEEGPTPEALAACVQAGLAAIPAESRYAQLIRDIIQIHKDKPDDWRAAWQMVEDRWGHEDLCTEGDGTPFNIDAKVNGGYVVIGLLYGDGDFDKTMEIATRCGQDADCNPSSAAGILGTLTGYKAIPSQFTAGIPPLTGQKFSYTDYDFPALIAACEAVAAGLLDRAGGRIVEKDGHRILEIPAQRPTPPANLVQLHDTPREQILQYRADFDQRRKDHADVKP